MRRVLFLALLVACGKSATPAPVEPTTGDDDDGDEVTTPEAEGEGLVGRLPGIEHRLTDCLAMTRCRDTYPYADCDGCFTFDDRYQAAFCDLRPEYLSYDDIVSLSDAGKIVYDEDAWAECEPAMDRLDTIDCAAYWDHAMGDEWKAGQDACTRAMTGQGAKGDACEHDVECRSFWGCSDDGTCS